MNMIIEKVARAICEKSDLKFGDDGDFRLASAEEIEQNWSFYIDAAKAAISTYLAALPENNMTSPAQREFEAYYAKSKYVLQTDDNGYYGQTATNWGMWQAAIASQDKLRDAVIVLDDGAEPEVGDLLAIKDMGDINYEVYEDFRENWHITNSGAYRDLTAEEYKIIRRAGKAVVYQSELGEV